MQSEVKEVVHLHTIIFMLKLCSLIWIMQTYLGLVGSNPWKFLQRINLGFIGIDLYCKPYERKPNVKDKVQRKMFSNF